MKKLFLLNATCLIGASLFCQNTPVIHQNNYREREKLKGNVKSFEEYIYVAERFGEIEKKDGVNILHSRFSTGIDGGSLYQKNVFDYHNNGEEIQMTSYGGLLTPRGKDTYKFNDEGNKIEENTGNGNVTFKYNNKGKIIEECRHYPNGKVRSKNVFDYDTKGNQIEKTNFAGLESWYVNGSWHHGDTIVVNNKETYKYDDKGNKIEMYKYSPSPEFKPPFGNPISLSGWSTYKYDDKGNKIEENEYEISKKDLGLFKNEKGKHRYKILLDTLAQKRVFEYNTKGNLMQVNFYQFQVQDTIIIHDDYGTKFLVKIYDTSKFTIHQIFVYKYDAIGNKIEEKQNRNTGEYLRWNTYKYDIKGNIIELGSLNTAGVKYAWNTYKYDITSKLIERCNYSLYGGPGNKGGLQSKSTFKYDTKGNKIEENTYDGKGGLTSKTIFKYDNKGKKIEENEYDGKGGLKLKSTFKHDNKGNQIEYSSLTAESQQASIITFQYDSKGNQIEMNIKNPRKEISFKYTYKYDEKGNQIEMNKYKSDGSFSGKYSYKYDDRGNQAEEKIYNTDGSFSGRYTYKYDEKGNQIEMNYYNSDSTLNSGIKWAYKYKFDNNGNWTSKISFKNEIPVYVHERKYKYDDLIQSAPTTQPITTQRDFKTLSQNFVLNRLKSPSTAIFGAYLAPSETRDLLNKGLCNIKECTEVTRVTVNAQNGFGAYIKSDYFVFFANCKPCYLIDAKVLEEQEKLSRAMYLRIALASNECDCEKKCQK